MNRSQPVITTRSLKKSFDGEEYVLRGIDLEIYPGQVIGYIGPNGAGKTTTVKILIGMIPEYEGEVDLFGHNLSSESLIVKQRIGYVPETAALYDTLTPIEWLQFIGQIYKIPLPEVTERANQMLTIFDLASVAGERMNTFSKGMKQKVLIISALIHDPDLLFLDEPLSGLDANSAMVIKEILAQLAGLGKTIFYCSHVMDVVERVCDRIIIIDRGEIIANGSFDELQAQSREKSLENIFSSLTGSSGHEEKADQFIAAFRGGAL